MRGHDIIVIGFSAGGVEALARLAADLPRDLPAAVFVVHHFPAEGESALPNIVRRAGRLPALHPVHGQQIEPGRIYIAPPGRHMIIVGDRIHLTRGPRENGHRPAIDPLFRTAARTFGSRVVGVLLSGTLDDGTVGMMAVKQHGGTAVVQDPNEALYPGMLDSAIQRVGVDHVLPVQEVAQLLTRLTREPVAQKEGGQAMLPEDQEPRDPAEIGTASLETGTLPGPPTALTCPECGGTLWELISGDLVRYRCHVGHAYTSDSMAAEQGSVLEGALWTALRALEEKAELSRRLAERSRSRGLERLARRYEGAVEHAERGSNDIRQLLLSGTVESPVPSDAGTSQEETTDWAIATTAQERV
jgi:two-component system, chemotaxis family, protein-glutamate methylesterase/glutaminase